MEIRYQADIDGKWFRIQSVGNYIEKTSIIAFKTPLNEYFNEEIQKTEQFTIKDLLEQVEQQGKRLSALINLTKIDQKGYTVQDLNEIDQNIKFYKFPLETVETPDMETLEEIHQIMEEYDKQGLGIGVHCKHGVNRTGYVVCSYLILRKGYTWKDAVKGFQQCRGAPITRNVYVKQLKKLVPNTIPK